MVERLKKLKEKLKNPKTIVAIGVLGILLIFISNFIPKGNAKTEIVYETSDINAYTTELQNSTKELVKKITGLKDVTVLITLDTGYTYNYADAKTINKSDRGGENSSEQEQEYIIITDSAGNQKALLINEQLPEIRGVAVVYGAADSKILNQKIENALCATLQITAKRIYISGEGGK